MIEARATEPKELLEDALKLKDADVIESTIRDDIWSLYRKLDCSRREEAIQQAERTGFVLTTEASPDQRSQTEEFSNC